MLPEDQVKIGDDDGNELPRNEVGTVYLKAPDVGRFEYFKAKEKTDSAYRGDYYTLGDVGYMDDEGYPLPHRPQRGPHHHRRA